MELSRISFEEKRKLENLCRTANNFTDGGHWDGPGKAPDCDKADRRKSTHSHTYKFITTEQARKWNEDWRRGIMTLGHLGTILLGAHGMQYSGKIGATAFTAAGILKDEVGARLEWPEMERGWTYEVITTNEYVWIPRFPGHFTQTLKGVSRNEEGKIVKTKVKSRKYRLSELPQDLALILTSKPYKKTTSIYD